MFGVWHQMFDVLLYNGPRIFIKRSLDYVKRLMYCTDTWPTHVQTHEQCCQTFEERGSNV
jgi:hypothetical protein